MSVDQSVLAGQAIYTPVTLRLYDMFVLGFSNKMLWRCPTRELERLYNRNVSARHLDVGVGTGYYLDKTRWPSFAPTITLVDLNPHSLKAAAKRINRHAPETVVANVLEPLPITERFDSVALCYLLHCLPGTMRDKAAVLDHVLPLMNGGARIFGATIVQGDAPRSFWAKALMKFYNAKGVFSNVSDTIEDVEYELQKRFRNVRVTRRGTVAVFEATKP